MIGIELIQLNPISPDIRSITEKKIVGKSMKMNYANNKTAELWKSFMPLRKKVLNRISEEVISMQIFDSTYSFSVFNSHQEFEKWAAVEVSDFYSVPDELESNILRGGLYAVFAYVGSSADTTIFEYIFTQWLPASPYKLDQRPHFEILGDKFKRNDPSSEEEIWIPIKLREAANLDS